jgi:Zn-dependent peptidase ImmA (M78 family)/transcriptional regulator with XRE-family HTH domain
MVDAGKHNPVMVVVARESRGMTQSALASATGLSASKLSKYENGLLQISDDDIARIANATGFRSSFFSRNDPVFGLGSSLLFNRRLKTTPITVQRQVQARVNVVRIQIERLLSAAELESSSRIERLDVDACDGDPRIVARRVRAALRLPMGPVQNLTAAIESTGGIIVSCNFDAREIDAAHLWLPGRPPMFFMNSDRPGDRYRFNLAHELGHAVMHEFPVGNIEKQANEFAAEFLMPSEEIQHELEGLTIEKAARLKQRWKVSMSALIYNGHRLGCITDKRMKSLYIRLRSMLRGYHEPIEVQQEEPSLLRQLVQIHRRALGYGDEELRQLFMMDDPDFVVFPGDVGPGPKPLRIDSQPIKIDGYRNRSVER